MDEQNNHQQEKIGGIEMNAENVTPYGKFNHEIATQYGSVKAFKEAQKALLNTVKKNSFENGYSAGQKELLPWLIGTGVVALGLTGYEVCKFVKTKVVAKKNAKAQIEEDAKKAEEILIETPMDEELIKEIKKEKEED